MKSRLIAPLLAVVAALGACSSPAPVPEPQSEVARDDEPINLAGDWWDHAGTSAADGDEGAEALHVLYHRRRRTETEASDA